MNPEVKKLWVEALRSGEYKQDKNFLKTDAGHCCLGVLCDLYAREHPDSPFQWYKDESTDYEFSLPRFNGTRERIGRETCTLLPEIIVWAGLNRCNPFVSTDEEELSRRSLAELNDNEGYSFNEIADLIEKQL